MSKNRIEKWDEVKGNVELPKMDTFLDESADRYAILQLRYSDETAERRFLSIKNLKDLGMEPEIDHYELVYTAPLLPYKDHNVMLEEIYTKFNVARPEDFTGHSLSVSDIVAIQQNGVVTCHYVDSIGFMELPHFMKPENYLRNAAMAMEDDYGMIDGIINNGRKYETEERDSVLEQLKEKQKSALPLRAAQKVEDKER